MKENNLAVPVDAVSINFEGGDRRNVKVNAAIEAPTSIYVNRERFVTLFATPVMLKELVIGHLLGEGIARSIKDMNTVSVRSNNVYITTSEPIDIRISAYKHSTTITSDCASTEDFYKILDRVDAPMVTSDCRVSIKEILAMTKLFGGASSKRKLSAALHSTGVFQGGELVAFAEDVSRYASTDKAIGAAALNDVDFNNSVLLGTGRQPASMVLKMARVGIPLSISIRGSIESGIYAAKRTGVTVACFARRRGLTVFSNPERITA